MSVPSPSSRRFLALHPARAGKIIARVALVSGLAMAAGALPAHAQYYDRPPGYIPYERLPPEPVPEAPWGRPWAPPMPMPERGPPRGAYVDDVLSRGEIEAMLARRGYRMESPLRRRGHVYVADVMDRRGTILRLTIDAYDGAIIRRRVVAEVVPDWGDGPARGVARADPGWDEGSGQRLGYDDEAVAPRPRAGTRNSDERYATREAARPIKPMVIPAPPMPKVPHPPMRPPALGSDTGEAAPTPPGPPVAQAQPSAQPMDARKPAASDKPAVIDIPRPDLPEVPPPSF